MANNNVTEAIVIEFVKEMTGGPSVEIIHAGSAGWKDMLDEYAERYEVDKHILAVKVKSYLREMLGE